MTYTITFDEIMQVIFTTIGLIMIGFALYWMIKDSRREINEARRFQEKQTLIICNALAELIPDNSTSLDCIADTLVDIADSAIVLKEYIEMEIVTDAKQKL